MLVGKPSLRVWRWNGHSWKSLFVLSCVFLVGNMLQGQTLSVVWPEDVLDGSCEESIDLFQEQPQVEEEAVAQMFKRLFWTKCWRRIVNRKPGLTAIGRLLDVTTP